MSITPKDVKLAPDFAFVLHCDHPWFKENHCYFAYWRVARALGIPGWYDNPGVFGPPTFKYFEAPAELESRIFEIIPSSLR